MSRKDRGSGTPHPHPFLPRHGGETGYVTDMDAFWNHLKERGFGPDIPRDASWGERYFPMPDPDGNELSFAPAAPPLTWKELRTQGEPPTAQLFQWRRSGGVAKSWIYGHTPLLE